MKTFVLITLIISLVCCSIGYILHSILSPKIKYGIENKLNTFLFYTTNLLIVIGTISGILFDIGLLVMLVQFLCS